MFQSDSSHQSNNASSQQESEIGNLAKNDVHGQNRSGRVGTAYILNLIHSPTTEASEMQGRTKH